MINCIQTSAVHHITLTVSDIQHSLKFYTRYLGFQFVLDFEPRVLLSNGSLLLALTPPPDPERARINDRFDENRIGLDHVSLGVRSRADLETAAELFEKEGVPHGEVKELPGFGITVLAFRDPDNIQVELTALNSAA